MFMFFFMVSTIVLNNIVMIPYSIFTFSNFYKQKTGDELKLFFFRSEASKNYFFYFSCKCLLVSIVKRSKQLTGERPK